MFWKKKTKNKSSSSLEVDFDPDRREFFRIKPAQDYPVYFRVRGRDLRVADISAGGLALAVKGLPEGKLISGQLILPGYDDPLDISVSILHSGQDRPTACLFQEINEYDREVLHQYVLTRQKKALEEERRLQKEKNLKLKQNKLDQ